MMLRPHILRSLPPVAVALTAAGVLPFALLSVLSVGDAPGTSLTAVRGLIGYGAVVLAFLGGVHWGFTLNEPRGVGEAGETRAIRTRLALGVVPSLIGWSSILCGIISRPAFGLAILIAGFVATVVVESRVAGQELMPNGYMTLRWVASVVVLALLTTVLVLRVAGARVLL